MKSMASRKASCFVGVAMLTSLLLPVNEASARYETKILASTAEVGQFFGTTNVKVVYINKSGTSTAGNTLEYIDYSENSVTPTIHRITSAVNPLVPVISPDGRWVVFASSTGTGEAGTIAGTKSSIYFCKLRTDAVPVLLYADSAFEPRFVMNPASGKPTVIFPTQAPDYAWEGKGRTMAIEIDTTGGVPHPGQAYELFTQGGYTGGLSYDNQYLCGGGGLVSMLDLLSGRSRPDTIGPIGYNTPEAFSAQACNASITSSRIATDQVMFLDFGSGRKTFPNVNGGKRWGTWQVIFIANSSKELVRSYAVPRIDPLNSYEIPNPTANNFLDTTSIKWHHSEWSNHPYFAAATINLTRLWGKDAGGMWQSTEKQERIALLDLRAPDKCLQIVGPASSELTFNPTTNYNGLYNPGLWVAIPNDFAETGVLSERHRVGAAEFMRFNGVIVTNGLFVAKKAAIASINVFDLFGALVAHKTFAHGSTQWHADELTPGAYVAQVATIDKKSSILRFGVFK